MAALPSTATQAQVTAAGTSLQAAGDALAGAATGGLSHLPPACDAQLTRDLGAFYADETTAGSEYSQTGQTVAAPGATADDVRAVATQASAVQGKATGDLGLVTADFKTLSG
jgi:hypothetical protein